MKHAQFVSLFIGCRSSQIPVLELRPERQGNPFYLLRLRALVELSCAIIGCKVHSAAAYTGLENSLTLDSVHSVQESLGVVRWGKETLRVLPRFRIAEDTAARPLH